MILSFLLTCLIIELTPGPNMGYLAVLSARSGRQAGFMVVAGIASGLLTVGVLAALGIGAVIAASPFLYQLLRWAGVLYMLYLAWESWWPEDKKDLQRDLSARYREYFLQGFITNVLNPKAAVFYVALLPSFVVAGGHYYSQVIVMTLSFVFLATAIHMAIVALSGLAHQFLQDEKRINVVRKASAILLVGVAIWLGLKP